MHTLEFFSDPICFCRDKAKSLITKILQDFSDISFKEVNILTESERAQEIGVIMSPTLVLNGKIIAIGLPEENQLKKILLENIK
ncbi:MAG: thioredoxin family protein [Candidatus Omnitrophica bacterium]|nr:thioredoxin family protein [Candidatus Omnitrophota bacterium]